MKSKVYIKPPAGVVPEGKQPGQTFSVVCDFRVEKDGRICLTKIGDSDTNKEEDDQTESKSKPSYEDETKQMQGLMAAPMQQG